MKKAIVVLLMMGMGIPALAADGPEVQYVNGTAQGVKERSIGTVDTTAAKALEFHAGGAGFSIPYDEVVVYKYREENRFRLGVLPAIAAGILKARSKRHLLTITWKDGQGVAEVVTLEGAKDDALGLVALLRARATNAECGNRMQPVCGIDK
jgi:hypothetical protein